MSRDIKDHYDVQTPFRTVSLYNVFLFNRNAEQAFKIFNDVVKDAIHTCEKSYQETLKSEGFDKSYQLRS